MFSKALRFFLGGPKWLNTVGTAVSFSIDNLPLLPWTRTFSDSDIKQPGLKLDFLKELVPNSQ